MSRTSWIVFVAWAIVYALMLTLVKDWASVIAGAGFVTGWIRGREDEWKNAERLAQKWRRP